MRALALIAAMTLISACGFQLRGQATLAPALGTAELVVQPFDRTLRREVEQLLRANDVKLVANASASDARIRLSNVRVAQEIQSVGSRARVREFAMVYHATLSAEDGEGKVLLAPRSLEIRRDYTFDQNQVLGVAGEEEILREEMARDMASRILIELEAAAR